MFTSICRERQNHIVLICGLVRLETKPSFDTVSLCAYVVCMVLLSYFWARNASPFQPDAFGTYSIHTPNIREGKDGFFQ